MKFSGGLAYYNRKRRSTSVHRRNKIKTQSIWPYFFVLILISGSFLAGIIGGLYHFESRASLRQIESEEQASLKLQLALNATIFNTIISDLLFLSKQNELLRLINFNETHYKKWMSKEYIELSRRKKNYDQIRYIDMTGMEIVRVNFNNGDPKSVEKPDLQFKGNRYYFKETIALDRNEIFISPLDLNIENKEIQRPFKPVIRFGIPVFDEKQDKSGIILLNYLAANMLRSIDQAAKLSQGRAMLVNSAGFWLFSPNKEDEWGFMIDGRAHKKFPNQFPMVWKMMMASDNCQINTQNGLFTASTIYPLRQSVKNVKSGSGSPLAMGGSGKPIISDAYFWKIVSHIPRKGLNADTHRLLVELVFLAIMLFVFSLVPAWIMAKAAVRRKRYQISLYHSANYDKLTGLPNRSMFLDRLNETLKQARRYERKFALLFIDLDGFKSVNDTLGHDAGDDLLVKVAERLKKNVRESDTAARLGGDEFTVIFSKISGSADAASGAQKINAVLSMPFKIKGRDIQIGASIGVSIYSDNAGTLDLLLKNADTAMYQAKQAGKNTYCMS